MDEFAWREASTAMMAENIAVRKTSILFPEVNWAGPDGGRQGREFQSFTFTVALLYRAFGVHEFLGRLVSALCGVWGIFVIYRLVHRLGGSLECALLAAAVLACLPGSVFIDRSFLPEGAMLALSLSAAWCFVAALDSRSAPMLLVAAALLCLAILTKLPALVVLFPIAWVVLTRLREGPKAFVSLPMFGTLVTAALVPVICYYALTIQVGLNSPVPHVAGLHNFLDRSSGPFWTWDHFWIVSPLWTMPFLLVGGLGLLLTIVRWAVSLAASKGSRVGHGDAFFLVWALGGVLFCVVASAELYDNWWNFHILSPMVAFFVATGLGALVQPLRMRWQRISTGLCLLAGFAAFGSSSITPWYERTYSTAAVNMGRALDRLMPDADLALTICEPVGDPVALYYSHRRGWVLPVLGDADIDWAALPEEHVAVAIVQSGRRLGATWLAFTLGGDRHKSYLGADGSVFRNYLGQVAVLAAAEPGFEIWRLK